MRTAYINKQKSICLLSDICSAIASLAECSSSVDVVQKQQYSSGSPQYIGGRSTSAPTVAASTRTYKDAVKNSDGTCYDLKVYGKFQAESGSGYYWPGSLANTSSESVTFTVLKDGSPVAWEGYLGISDFDKDEYVIWDDTSFRPLSVLYKASGVDEINATTAGKKYKLIGNSSSKNTREFDTAIIKVRIPSSGLTLRHSESGARVCYALDKMMDESSTIKNAINNTASGGWKSN